MHRSEDPRDYVGNMMVDFAQMKAFAEDPFILTEGEGVRVKDADDRWYIDGMSGTFCLSLGHRNPVLVEAGSKQLERLALSAPMMSVSDTSLALTKSLLALLPSQYTHLKLGSGGSEAVEAAIKMARQYHRQAGDPRKYKIISHAGGYHGVTGFALAATGWPHIRGPYEPMPGGFIHVATPDPYRPPFPVRDDSDVGRTYARLVEELIESEGSETVAAFITEPILMSAGVVVPPADYLPELREICNRNDVLLIFDEIITGFGRVGALFAAEQINVWPDILVVGKGMSGGYGALSATIITDRLAEAFWGEQSDNVHFAAGHTYAGNPVSCAIALAAIEQIVGLDLSHTASKRGEQVFQRLREIQDGSAHIGDVRGRGLLIGVEFVSDRETRQRFPAEQDIGGRLFRAAKRRGLLLRASHWMAVIAPPLTITPDDLEELLGIFEAAIHEALDFGAKPASGG